MLINPNCAITDGGSFGTLSEIDGIDVIRCPLQIPLLRYKSVLPGFNDRADVFVDVSDQ